ncbi:MAG: hypothetical protein F6K14_21315 [Symploca sp. SIO2C1]|nr:hypothetical protein [Symploca sp. SIO2C1]NEP12697.1 hypothetical protein [Symploca sp. SIO2C1]
MKDTQEKQLFTEITTEESATVNGGYCGYYQSWRPRYPRYYNSGYRRRYNQTVNVYFNNGVY